MPAYSSRNSGLSPIKKFCIFFFLMVVGGVGTAATLAAAGLVDVSFFSPREQVPVDWVLVPMAGRTVPVYSLVQRDDLNNPATGYWNEVRLPKDSLAPDTIIDRTKIIGRVLNHDKAVGFAFKESDFLPPGTRFGMVAGIPLGKRSVVCEAKKISGIHALQKGDRFDLVVTLPVPKNQLAAKTPTSAPPPAEPEVRVLVNNGAVVMPAHMRSSSDTAVSLMNGPRNTTKNVEEVAIAVDPEEIAGLTASLSSSSTITCVARSGHPDEPKTLSSTPGSTPQPPPIAIETVVGDSSSTMYFPNPSTEGATQRTVRVAGHSAPSVAESNDGADHGGVRQAQYLETVEPPRDKRGSTIRR